MTPTDLAKCTGATLKNANLVYTPLLDAMEEFGITTPIRQAMFLANVGHETGGFQWLSEIWGPTETQRCYEGRKDLGNTNPGDGSKYRGRGLIQVTGKANYAAAAKALGIDFVSTPDLLAQPRYAALSAGWFWRSHGLNEIADTGNFVRVVKVINGGTNGLANRIELFTAAKSVFQIT
ncbi:MAG: glycoside hydrolase family 19 protein [Pseudomonadota bacterium]